MGTLFPYTTLFRSAGGLVAVARTEFAVADRQVAVAVQALVEHLDVAGAVHRLHRVGPLLGLGEEHVVLVVVPVAGFLPKLDVEDLRAAHLAIAGVAVHAAHVLLRSEEHTSELQSLMRISYAVFCLKKKKTQLIIPIINNQIVL